MANAVCVLGSATPSLETLYNCQAKKHFTRLTLPNRVMSLPKPEMKIIDMTQQHFRPGGQAESHGVNLISSELLTALVQTLRNREQAILLLNRRGYSNFIYCPSCKYTLKCKNCDVTLTFHRPEKPQQPTELKNKLKGGFAMCHYCLSQTLVPRNCPLCGKGVTMFGLGSQRLEDELKTKLPDARVVRVDSDSMQHHDYYRLLTDFDAGRIDILAGTQILAKGLHFPNVTLVGIISADTSLQLPDFRANERTYQLICQVAGRAGRSIKGGRVYIQTFLPNQPAIKFAVNDDFDGFIKEELKQYLSSKGNEVEDMGPNSEESCDYPDYAFLVAQAVSLKKCDFGIMIDGAGIGSAMMANKVPGVLAACANEIYTARNSRQHNGANVLTLGSMVIGEGVAKEIVKIFLSTKFEGDRNIQRVKSILDFEKRLNNNKE